MQGSHRIPAVAVVLAILLPGCFLVPDNAVAPREKSDEDLAEMKLEDLLGVEYSLPIGVLGAHTHEAGDWMVGAKYMGMKMQGYLDGSDRVSDAEVLEDFEAIHTEMEMQTVMYQGMYAPTDDLTYMVMLPHSKKWARHLDGDGDEFRTSTEGWGDTQLHALYTIMREGVHRVHVDAGLSIPTGSITESNDGKREHYMMQMGSGTYDLLPGVTYLGETEQWSWGAQATSVIRLGRNSQGYSLGDRYALTSWIMRQVHENFAASLRTNAQWWGNIDGQDSNLDPTALPENDPNLQGGKRVDLLVGINYFGTDGPLEHHRLELEAGWPIYQNLDGPQMEVDFLWSLAWRFTF